ncbi:DUF2933 domain-containing protein [Deinococcus peraridilitoris]|uniref:DUF2933 domain-containing protein n=1 Tax=Deinococcus peraridilitoris (strain DSM 19664 / LMG 22246 / CIP 109416 / KR-200) TaxID=937777 RepID=L0A787_DEIPD|nr:DUF2933 domain-containing protein [Deinococcus peraridilitoris]AFZ69723.1 Protein of unknown function (DUF2933) [Deinococcus peraridilitoris DSM 19664]
MNIFKKCLNWKVMVGLAVVAAGLFVLVSPAVAVAALPFLVAAICPLSMLLMMKGMGKMQQNAQANAAAAGSAGTTQNSCCAPGKTLSREEQIAQLHVQLQDMQSQQERLTAQLRELNSPRQETALATPVAMAIGRE